tara:strand:- start:60353 stop:63076 length:2724 start_codon:yes stop_codon:yes gene_type:complete
MIFCLKNYSQSILSGKVTDADSGEPLIGASVIYGSGLGVSTDFDGNYSIKISNDEINLKVSYIGYKTIEKTINIQNNHTKIDFKLNTILLNEIEVVADIARDRETPIAFSTVPIKKINEELASQDIPMILNSTPGVYATQTGGGDGDARITIRGFNQRNVAVMIDGIPVNDMENGWVYWSNWFGLDAVTSNIQIQRGLGTSKIAIPSVGGTMNILTKSVANNRSGMIKQEIGSYGKLRTSIGFNSGKNDNGWGYTLAGSYKRGNGFVDMTWTEGYFYYAKLQKELDNHIFSLSIMGAPQEHGQRTYKSDIATYDTSISVALGDTTDFSDRIIINKGIQYNKHWGWIDRWQINENGDTIHSLEKLNTKKNYYHKPQFSLRHFWTLNENFYLSNIIYTSIGSGGGTSWSGNSYDNSGQLNLQDTYNGNFAGPFSIDPSYSDTERKSGNYLKSSINNHFWYGGLSTINYQKSLNLNFSGGVDLRYYKGEHYKEIYDLLGGDYAVTNDNANQLTSIKRVGDIITYHNDGLVKWSGLFFQSEYSDDKISSFINISGSYSGYKRVDYFRKKDLVLSDTTIREAIGTHSYFGDIVSDTLFYDGKVYTIFSEETQNSSTDWKWIKGFTVKGGANLNLNQKNNTFFNIGYISKAPRFDNIYNRDNTLLENIRNEIVKAAEWGYCFRSSKFSANLNSYYTIWENKPLTLSQNILGNIYRDIVPMNALHKGLETDFSYKINNKLIVEGLVSLGDWIWTSGGEAILLDNDNNPPSFETGSTNNDTLNYNANGVHVGDAAQTQYGFSMRYEPTYNTYLKIRFTHFADYYSDFDGSSLVGENSGRESWVIPSYNLVDFHTGFNINNWDFKLSILNSLNKVFISDATNNDSYNSNFSDFDAKSAGVFFGLGRRFMISAKFNF